MPNFPAKNIRKLGVKMLKSLTEPTPFFAFFDNSISALLFYGEVRRFSLSVQTGRFIFIAWRSKKTFTTIGWERRERLVGWRVRECHCLKGGGRNPTAADGENAKEVSAQKKREVTGKYPEFPPKKVLNFSGNSLFDKTFFEICLFILNNVPNPVPPFYNVTVTVLFSLSSSLFLFPVYSCAIATAMPRDSHVESSCL